jgi:hypothetical protein
MDMSKKRAAGTSQTASGVFDFERAGAACPKLIAWFVRDPDNNENAAG